MLWWNIGWLKRNWPPPFSGSWLSDGLSMHESLDCALSFLIKSIITLYVSAHHHAFNFFQYLQNGNRDVHHNFWRIADSAKTGRKFAAHSQARTARTHTLLMFWIIGFANLRRRELTFMMKPDSGDPSQTFLHRLLGCSVLSNLIQLVIMQGNWQWPRR
jgi:hypothetical protein